jgi:hypothetical protein
MNGLGNIIIENKEVENERLELTDKTAHYFLGPNLTLRRCTLVLKVSARCLFFDRVRFIDCTFEVKQELKNHQQWISASLEGCRFKGRLTGCDFGSWPEYGSEPAYQFGSINDCDFTEARLEGCRFMGCDPATLRFPKWPCFTFIDPIGRARELNSVQWPGLVGPVTIETLFNQPPSTVALTEQAVSIAKRLDTTPEELKAVIEKFDCIVY